MFWKRYWPAAKTDRSIRPGTASCPGSLRRPGALLLCAAGLLAFSSGMHSFPKLLQASQVYRETPAATAQSFHNILTWGKDPTVIYYASAYFAEEPQQSPARNEILRRLCRHPRAGRNRPQ